jgi:MOSC domain-containing protein YiiM
VSREAPFAQRPRRAHDADPCEGRNALTAHLASVNVGRVRAVEWHGRTVTTAIWKSPLAGRVYIGFRGLSGDEQADPRVHGGPEKAVYAYSSLDYRWWEQEAGEVLEPGTFGENLTVEGLDLGTAVTGDEWHVGSAVLAVTQPRGPCFKLGLRMGDAAFVKRFSEAGRLGTYLRVVEPGEVETGDIIVVRSGGSSLGA